LQLAGVEPKEEIHLSGRGLGPAAEAQAVRRHGGTAFVDIPYLQDLSNVARVRYDLNEIRQAISANGYWEKHDEWRISTVMSKRIELAKRAGRSGFTVRVNCDHDLQCHCPTLERAIEFLGVYDGLVQDLFYTLGWPSWATKTQMDRDA
jgi:hypothetical protein